LLGRRCRAAGLADQAVLPCRFGHGGIYTTPARDFFLDI